MDLTQSLILLIRGSVRTRTRYKPHICVPVLLFVGAGHEILSRRYNENKFPFLFWLITRLSLLFCEVRWYVGRSICWFNTLFSRIHLIIAVLIATTNNRCSNFDMQHMKVCLPIWFSFINPLSHFVLGSWLFMWEEAKQYGLHPSIFFSHSSNSPVLKVLLDKNMIINATLVTCGRLINFIPDLSSTFYESTDVLRSRKKYIRPGNDQVNLIHNLIYFASF